MVVDQSNVVTLDQVQEGQGFSDLEPSNHSAGLLLTAEGQHLLLNDPRYSEKSVFHPPVFILSEHKQLMVHVTIISNLFPSSEMICV